ncbi:DUF3570 domain-containing protein [Pelodictyon luteolum]|uniref:DUF3570 domain-containing protein n=1 Tax=Chlorobium luteolum (strain DSM 273 / BCRC 81028 / 2530) TaxID=319225 RepID=Q3B2K7_CHLL3|nr:DUF3570 domain-containing protein [Pelodictyon luteolum]ABB24424.1 conserved hypothetical protein [Pelodictyon luteolum DSM 273]
MTKTSIQNNKPNVLGAALVGAAIASLPSVQFAHAESAPERGIVSFKYLNYKDSQTGPSTSSGEAVDDVVSYDALSGASGSAGSGGDDDRININAYSVYAMTPIAGKWSVGGTLTYDAVSGASPSFHSFGLSAMEDTRKAADLQLTRYFSRGSVTAGTSYSSESDYISRNYSLQASLSTEDNNTTLTMGASMTRDSINPNNQPNLHEKKNIDGGLIGVTQVVSKNDIVQLNLGYSGGTGYYSDPYKINDNRPRKRNMTTFMARWNHHFDETDGSGHFSYRYYSDTFGIRAHMLGAEYVQPLGDGWTVTPLLRLYSQTEADFYVKTTAEEIASLNPADNPAYQPPQPSGIYYTHDQRLSAFGAITAGLKVSKQIDKDWTVDAKYEYYHQDSGWSISGNPDSGLYPFSARTIQIGVSRLL